MTTICVTQTMKSNLSQCKKMKPKQWSRLPVAFEVFLGYKQAKPYYDFDLYIDDYDKMTEAERTTTKTLLINNCKKSLSKFSEKIYEGKSFSIDSVSISSLHGTRCIKKKQSKNNISKIDNPDAFEYKYKFSLHFVDNNGLIIAPVLLKQKIIQHEELFENFENWDKSVYSDGQQKFRLPTSRKEGNELCKPQIINGDYESFHVSAIQDLEPSKKYEKNIMTKLPSKKKKSDKKTKKNNDINNIEMEDNGEKINEKDEIEIEKLLEIISSDDYDTWTQVGFFLKQYGNYGFKIWNNWSKESYKYDGVEITKKKWLTFSNETSLTIRRLHKFASESNFNKYVEYFDSDIKVISQVFFLDEDVIYANYLIEVEKIQNKIKSIGTKGECYVYNEDTALWSRQLMKNQTKFMCDLLANKLNDVVIPYHKTLLSKIDESEIDLMKQKIQNLNKVYKRLNRMSVRKNILSAITDDVRIRDDNFLFKLTKNKNLISINENVIDLKTGSQRKRMESDYQVTTIIIEDFKEYKPENHKEKTDFGNFVYDIMKDNEKIYNYIHKLLGYFITKETKEGVSLFLTGFGSNGKSLLTNVLTNVLGSNCSKVPSEIFDANQKVNTNSASPQEASLFNVCIGVITETNENLKLDKKFKELVDSGNNEKARHLNGDLFEFEKTAKFLFTTNNIPIFKAEKSFVRRIKICPFNQTYSKKDSPEWREGDKEINYNKQEELLEKKHEIINWLIDGAIKWYKRGLEDTPKKMEAEIKLEMESNNWLSDFTYVSDPSSTVKNDDIKEILIMKGLLQKGSNMRSHQIKALQNAGFKRSSNGAEWTNIVYNNNKYQGYLMNNDCDSCVSDSDSDCVSDSD